MSANLIAGLLELWPDLALRGGAAWRRIRGEAARLLEAYGQAADQAGREQVEIELLLLFEEAGLGQLLFRAALGATAGPPTPPPAPGWSRPEDWWVHDRASRESDDSEWRSRQPDEWPEPSRGHEQPGPVPRGIPEPPAPPPAAPPEPPAPPAGGDANAGVSKGPRGPEEPLAEAIERRLAAEAGRSIDAWVEGLGADEPLAAGRRYELVLGEGAAGAARRASGPIPADLLAGAPVEALVVLTSADLTVHGPPQQVLVLGATPAETRPARFSIEPHQDGQVTARALVFIGSRLIQDFALSFVVGAPERRSAGHSARARGLALAAALGRAAAPHRLSLTIVRREAGYELLLVSGSVTRATLRISEAQLAGLIARARDVVAAIGRYEDGGVPVYAAPGASIPDHIHQRALRALADLGAELYQRLFFAPGSGADAHQIGQLLSELSSARRLRIQVVGERFIFPWTLLYDQPGPGPVDPRRFWGFRHTVEYLPEFSSPTLVSLLPEIEVGDGLAIGYIFNEQIDREVAGRPVAAQGAFLRDLPGVSVSEHATCEGLYGLLNGAARGQLLYFYCHAVGPVPGEAGGAESARLILSDGEAWLRDLYRRAPVHPGRLREAPLVFLNACESAELSPYLYEGLVPYFITKGARGVVGTEASVPAQFAAEFAEAVIGRFVGGATLGGALHRARHFFLRRRRNVLGLLYALYCDADVRVRRSSPSGSVTIARAEST